MNIYEMYYANNKKYNFWVQRYTWGNTVAKIISIGDAKEGKPLGGRKPYYKNQKVLAEFYKIINKKYVFDNISELRAAGTFGYSLLKNIENFKIIK
jgi:hypothetical protein